MLVRRSEVSVSESRFLGELARQAPAGRPIIEIGTLFGSSTRVLATFKAEGTPLITVDSFRWNTYGFSRGFHARVTAEILRELTEHHHVRLLQMDKREFYATYDGPPPGLVFLDAKHSFESTREDILWAKTVGAEIVCGHDYKDQFPGVIQAVAECGGAERVVGSVFVLNKS